MTVPGRDRDATFPAGLAHSINPAAPGESHPSFTPAPVVDLLTIKWI
jgi:hypothetical protein